MSQKASSLEKLKAASASEERSMREQIAEGEHVWLAGPPRSSEEGTVAVGSASGFVSVVSEDDVLEVLEDEDQFYVRISSDTNVLVRLEQVLKARPSPKCPCCSGEAASMRASSGSGSLGERAPVPIPPLYCWTEVTFECVWVRVGTYSKVCVVTPIARRVCAEY